MRQVIGITDDPIQRHTILLGPSEVVLTLRFLPTVQIWTFDAEYEGFEVFGLKLSLGTLHMQGENQPFDFVVKDRSGEGIDPFRRIDFSSDRCRLFILDPEDMADIRGQEVPL